MYNLKNKKNNGYKKVISFDRQFLNCPLSLLRLFFAWAVVADDGMKEGEGIGALDD